MQIFVIAHYHKFICIEYQHFHDKCAIFLVICNVNNNTIGISIITFAKDTKKKHETNCLIWKIRQIKMHRIFYVRKSQN